MDNQQTGRLIRELRTEQGMTQRELAQRLHVTDRAVSKWERGLCAPDLSLLEPLADALGCSIPELIAGQRTPPDSQAPEPRAQMESVIAYSLRELREKAGRSRGRLYLASLICMAVLAVCGALLWRSGVLFTLDRTVSPDGTREITAYSKALHGGGFSQKDAVSLIVRDSGGSQWRVIYGPCRYLGSWWAPDSEKYVVALEDNGEVRLELTWLERNASSNLNAYLSTGVEASELARSGYAYEDGWPEIQYQFLQWSRDSTSMLIYYAFQDDAAALHDGYFWYNCETCTVSAVLAMDPR